MQKHKWKLTLTAMLSLQYRGPSIAAFDRLNRHRILLIKRVPETFD